MSHLFETKPHFLRKRMVKLRVSIDVRDDQSSTGTDSLRQLGGRVELVGKVLEDEFAPHDVEH
jgi:hypothetical protein